MAASRKLYENLAKTINYHYRYAPALDRWRIESLVKELCLDLKQDNMGFNKDRFLKACGIPE